MKKIRLEISDFLYNAGIVGIAKILEFAELSFTREANYIEFDESYLEGFEELYFNYFVETYNVFTSYYNIVKFEDYIDNFDLEKAEEGSIEYINRYIDYLKGKLTSNSYKSAYSLISSSDFDILEREKNLKKLKITKKQSVSVIAKDIVQVFSDIKDVIDYLKRDEVQKYIKAKNIIYDVIQNFWSNASFLNKTKSNSDMYVAYKVDFIESAQKYMAADRTNFKYPCFTCTYSIENLSKPNAFDLAWLNQIGVDIKRKTSHFWNLKVDSYICPICNLVYSCIPAGFTVIKNNAIFINENSSIRDLISVNKFSLNSSNLTLEDIEEEGYYKILDIMEQNRIDNFEREADNIQIVKLYTVKERNKEKQKYTFNILSKEKLSLIGKHKTQLKYLIHRNAKVGKDYYINIFREVLKRLYNDTNQFDLIHTLVLLNLQGNFKSISAIKSIINLNDGFLGSKRRVKMVGYKDINKFISYGLNLREKYLSKSAKNKIPGITYRLTNALNTKDANKFINTLINAYLYDGSLIPTSLGQTLNDVDKLRTLGYAFIIGFQGIDSEQSVAPEETKGNVEGENEDAK